MPYKDKEQQRAAQQAWYQYNKNAIIDKQRLRRSKVRDFIRVYKEENSECMDCGISYPPHVLDFDHLGDKEFGVSEFSKHTSPNINKIKMEIDKCEIVCSNCHRIRTWNRSF